MADGPLASVALDLITGEYPALAALALPREARDRWAPFRARGRRWALRTKLPRGSGSERIGSDRSKLAPQQPRHAGHHTIRIA